MDEAFDVFKKTVCFGRGCLKNVTFASWMANSSMMSLCIAGFIYMSRSLIAHQNRNQELKTYT